MREEKEGGEKGWEVAREGGTDGGRAGWRKRRMGVWGD